MSIKFLINLKLKSRHIKRFRAILYILIKNGFGDIVNKSALFRFFLGARKFFSLRKKGQELKKKLVFEKRVRLTLQELGPTFIKFGQIMASRSDLLPIELINELKYLQDKVAPFPFEQCVQTIEREFGKPLDHLFDKFEEKPIASASIAQVHHAFLKDGREVAVKVKRPNIDKIIASDIEILSYLARVFEKNFSKYRQFQPVHLIEEFNKTIKRELNFQNELMHLEVFRKNFENEPELHVPVAYQEFCTPSVITMEFIYGTKIDEKEKLLSLGFDLNKIVANTLRLTVDSIFKYRFFHADPHAGNFFIMDDGRLCLLDFGIIGHLSEDKVEKILSYMYGLLTGDTTHLVYSLIDMKVLSMETNIDELKNEIDYLLAKYTKLTLKEVNVAGFLEELFSVLQQYHVLLPPELLLVFKTMSILEGMARNLTPEFNPLEELKKYILPVYIEKYTDPDYIAKKITNSLYASAMEFKQIPGKIKNIITLIEKGEFSIALSKQNEKNIKKIVSKQSKRRMLIDTGFFFGAITAFHLFNTSVVSLPDIAGIALFTYLMVSAWFTRP